jgi:hypothetical protein
VISEPVLVNVHKNVAVNGKDENASDRAGQQDLQNQSIVESKSSAPGQLGEDQAAAKAQAAFRGYLVKVFSLHKLVQYCFSNSLMHLQHSASVTHSFTESLCGTTRVWKWQRKS